MASRVTSVPSTTFTLLLAAHAIPRINRTMIGHGVWVIKRSDSSKNFCRGAKKLSMLSP
ncbi:hypothetical protein D3C84_1054090 [compost metagenome]